MKGDIDCMLYIWEILKSTCSILTSQVKLVISGPHCIRPSRGPGPGLVTTRQWVWGPESRAKLALFHHSVSVAITHGWTPSVASGPGQGLHVTRSLSLSLTNKTFVKIWTVRAEVTDRRRELRPRRDIVMSVTNTMWWQHRDYLYGDTSDSRDILSSEAQRLSCFKIFSRAEFAQPIWLPCEWW